MVRLDPENALFFAFSEKSFLKGELREFEALLERLHKMKNESMQNLHQFWNRVENILWCEIKWELQQTPTPIHPNVLGVPPGQTSSDQANSPAKNCMS